MPSEMKLLYQFYLSLIEFYILDCRGSLFNLLQMPEVLDMKLRLNMAYDVVCYIICLILFHIRHESVVSFKSRMVICLYRQTG